MFSYRFNTVLSCLSKLCLVKQRKRQKRQTHVYKVTAFQQVMCLKPSLTCHALNITDLLQLSLRVLLGPYPYAVVWISPLQSRVLYRTERSKKFSLNKTNTRLQCVRDVVLLGRSSVLEIRHNNVLKKKKKRRRFRERRWSKKNERIYSANKNHQPYIKD